MLQNKISTPRLIPPSGPTGGSSDEEPPVDFQVFTPTVEIFKVLSLPLRHQFLLPEGLFLYRGVERQAQRNAGNPQLFAGTVPTEG